MRAKQLERHRAIALRRQGLSYSEIRQQVPVAKSSLSLWLRQVGLLDWQQRRLSEKELAAARSGARKRHESRLQRIARINGDARLEARKLLKKGEMNWLLGVSLYWAEGTKIKAWRSKERFMFVNSDPAMIKIVRNWLRRYCSVNGSDLDFDLYIHENADIRGAQKFWIRTLGIGRARLRTYLKNHNPSPKRRNTGTGYHGTMRVQVRKSVNLSHRIAGWIQGLIDYCGVG